MRQSEVMRELQVDTQAYAAPLSLNNRKIYVDYSSCSNLKTFDSIACKNPA